MSDDATAIMARLRRRYAAGLAVIAATLLALGLATTATLSSDKESLRLVNIAADQRADALSVMLSTKRLAVLEQARDSSADIPETAERLRDEAMRLRDTHMALAARADLPATLRTLFRGERDGVGLTRRIDAFATLALAVADAPDRASERLADLERALPPLMGEQAATSALFQKKAANEAERLRSAHLLTLGVALATVLLQALAVLSASSAESGDAVAVAERHRSMAEARRKEQSRLRRKAEHASTHDALTGLPNRRGLAEHIGPAPLAALLIDVDGFKHINDSIGRHAADAVLRSLAESIRDVVGPDMRVARVGDDEFAVILAEPAETDALERLARRVSDAASLQIAAGGAGGPGATLCVNIGIAKAGPADDLDRLLTNADTALRRSKQSGRGGHALYTDDLEARIERTRRLSDEMITGLRRGAFAPYYQPQVCARTLRVVGVEALARWRRQDGSVSAPFAFMDVAEALGLTAEIDHAVLLSGLRDLERWRREGVAIDRLSVNVSARRLEDSRLTEILDALDLPQGALAFEILESIYLERTGETLKWNLDYIRRRGIDIEVDDFGTGHTSVLGVMELQPSRLKIARELVAPITDSDVKRRLIASIIEMGRSLGVGLTAEGVETLEHAAILRDLGVDVLQGYAFAKPMPSHEVAAFVAAQAEAAWPDPLRQAG